MIKPLDILKKYWKHNSFRPLQQEIIHSVLENKNTLAILPTGGGKSVCFQVPAMCLEGICIVISPLVALMKDQVINLKKMGIPTELIHGGMSKREIDVSLDNCRFGEIKFLYLSPERLKNELFLERSKLMNISIIAIDEAHCISQWGHDFRPQYREICEFITMHDQAKVIALTGSATNQVKQDIETSLNFKKKNTFQLSFQKPNINFVIRKTENKDFELLKIVQNIPGSGIIYCKSRNLCEKISEFLNQHGQNTSFYHAGLSGEERDVRQDEWQNNKKRIIVSTNAFGMGIDKSDVRFVAHYNMPESLEAYYQECGRAGRDGNEAYAVCLTQEYDYQILEDNHQRAYPPLQKIKAVYQALANYYTIAVGSEVNFDSLDFHLEVFCERYKFKKIETYSALKKLEEANLIQLSPGFYTPSKLTILVTNTQYYEFSTQNFAYEKITKCLLRLYGGELFSHHKKISESEIATRIQESPNQIKKLLSSMHKMELIDFIESKDSPQIMFTSTRADAKHIPIDTKLLAKRKKLDLKRLHSVKNYFKNKNLCRQQYILDYFDEETNYKCGKCDVCRSSKKNHLKDLELQILEKLNSRNHNIKELYQQLDIETEVFRNIILKLSEEDKIRIEGETLRIIL